MFRFIFIFLFIVIYWTSSFSQDYSKSDLVSGAFAAIDRGDWEQYHKSMLFIGDRDIRMALRISCHSRFGCPAEFRDVADLIKLFPSSPMLEKQKRRAESLALHSKLSDRQLLNWFFRFEPQSSSGRIAYLKSLNRVGLGGKVRAEQFARKIWRNDYLQKNHEEYIEQNFRHILGLSDHRVRLENMLWKGHKASAIRASRRVGGVLSKVARARIALQGAEPGVDRFIKSIPESHRDKEGVSFDRILWRWRKGKKDSAIKLALTTPQRSLYADRWYEITSPMVSYLLMRDRHAEARKLLLLLGDKIKSRSYNYRVWRNLAYIEILWDTQSLGGQSFGGKRGNYSRGMDYMMKALSYADDLQKKTEVYYWIGRIYEIMGETDRSTEWYLRSSDAGMFFYGQVAALKIGAQSRINLFERHIKPTKAQVSKFLAKPIVRIAMRLNDLGMVRLARVYLHRIMDIATDPIELSLVAKLAYDMKYIDAGVYASRIAEKSGFLLDIRGYPWIKLKGKEKYPNLIMAVVRQESSFNIKAKSSSGAVGLMQLMPATARYVSDKAGLPFIKEKLIEDPYYNIRLGDWYLRAMIQEFDGNLVLALSSYNAGPGNVRRWQKRIGRPRSNIDSMIRFIERIPYPETKKYVKKVLTNFTIYRQLRGEKEARLKFLL